MATKPNYDSSLSHSRWNCKYHIVFIPKYRRKEIYGRLREDIGKIIRTLCEYKEVEIIEAHAMKDHIHMLDAFQLLCVVFDHDVENCKIVKLRNVQAYLLKGDITLVAATLHELEHWYQLHYISNMHTSKAIRWKKNWIITLQIKTLN